MALFSGESKEEKQVRKTREMLANYGLNSLSDPDDLKSVKTITYELMGNGFLEAGMALTGAKAHEQLNVSYLHAILEQNWIIIRQLDRLNRNLENLGSK